MNYYVPLNNRKCRGIVSRQNYNRVYLLCYAEKIYSEFNFPRGIIPNLNLFLDFT